MDAPDFSEVSIDFAKAGLDKNFTLFKLYTRKITDTQTGEVGQFDIDCKYPWLAFECYSDHVGLLKRFCREYLRHAVDSTKVPIEHWIIEFSPVMERYQVPSHLFLDTARDRAWLV